jgi:phytoene synthase
LPADIPPRPFIFAVSAFRVEIDKIPRSVTNTIIGEMRLQWWRDVLGNPHGSDSKSHPVARALFSVTDVFSIPPKDLFPVLDAYRERLYEQPFKTPGDLERNCEKALFPVLRIKADILDCGSAKHSAGFSEAMKTAAALLGLVDYLCSHSGPGTNSTLFVPEDTPPSSPEVSAEGKETQYQHGDLRQAFRTVARRLPELQQAFNNRAPSLNGLERLAFLNTCLTPAYIRAMEKDGFDPVERRLDIPFWKRHWLLWKHFRAIAGQG